MTITIRTANDARRLRQNIQILKMQLPGFQEFTLRQLADELLQRIHSRMRNVRFSYKVINGTKIGKIEQLGINKFRIHVISEYWTDTRFDVAVARERGTDIGKGGRHFVKPKNVKALKFPYKSITAFSKGHWVKGIPALRIIKRTIREFKSMLVMKYQKMLKSWTRQTLSSGLSAS